MKRRRALVWAGTAFLAVLALLFLVFQGLQDFDFSEYENRPLAFFFGDATIAGTLHLPDASNPPVVLLIHGDGPADRYSGGGYMPLISTLLDSGIAVYSWDKPGVGDSTGDWLTYSMQDRAGLTAAALEAVQAQPEFQSSGVGLVGFSQGGWVVPILAEAPAKADFFVIIGGAVNWLRQGRYYTKRRLELAGADIKAIEATLADDAAGNKKLLSDGYSYEAYLADHSNGRPMSESRFAFVRKNALADSSDNLHRISAPVLTLHGSDDLNVDPTYNSNQYRQILENRNDANRFLVIPDGSHALLRTALFNQQTAGDLPAWSGLAFALLGRKAYAPGTLDTLTSWILEQAGKAG